MAYEVDDVFDDDLELGLEDPDQPLLVDENLEVLEDDFLLETNVVPKKENLVLELLSLNGIKDGKVKILDENQKEEEVDFFSLPKEEQLEILRQSQPSKDLGLSEEEQKFIENLRTGNLSINEYLQKFKEDTLKDVAPQSESYDIDAYDDQELFLLDLKAKYDLSDEELQKELEKELQNEDIFNKKVSKLRTEYKQLEDTYKKEQQDNIAKEREDKYNEFVDKMVDVAVKSTDLYGIELEDSEKNEVLSFLLDLDENGVSNFYRDLQSPQKLYEAAWFMRYGKEAMEAIKSVYEEEITKLKKDKTQVVVQQNDKRIKSIHEI